MCVLCPPWLSFILYNPIRKALTDRQKVMDESGINKDSVVLEVGSGNGFLTEALAERAEKVFAVELQEGMVRKLKKRVGHFGERVEIIQADIADFERGEGIADVGLLYFSFHEVSGQAKAAESISRAVKKGGLLAIYEPSLEVNRAEMQKTVSLFAANGFVKETERDGLFIRFARMRKE